MTRRAIHKETTALRRYVERRIDRGVHIEDLSLALVTVAADHAAVVPGRDACRGAGESLRNRDALPARNFFPDKSQLFGLLFFYKRSEKNWHPGEGESEWALEAARAPLNRP